MYYIFCQVPGVTRDWRLNERHYGALTGLNKADCVERWGKEQVSCPTEC